jgi:glycogen debranching enzyme
MPVAATATLDRNWRDGYTLPSPHLYPFQWNWDAGFIALGLGYVRPERAIAELRSIFRGQWSNGMLPHIVFHRPAENYFPGPEVWGTDRVPARPVGVRTSGITQPPVFAFIIERLSSLPLGRTPEWQGFRREIFPALLAQHRHLYRHRDPLGEGLVYIQHNWEAGTDNSPVYDAALERIDLTHARDVAGLRRDNRAVAAAHRPTDANYRRYLALVDLFNACRYEDAEIAARSPFLIQDVLFNCVLARSNQALLALARDLRAEAAIVAEIEGWCGRTEAAINGKLWDAGRGFYFPFDLRAGRRIPIKTSSGFLPLLAGVCDAAQRAALTRHLTSSFAPTAEWLLCPSVAVDEPAFDPVRYWRGPVWVNLNWMLYHGLRRAGLDDLAARVRADTLRALASAGRWEYFDPRPGTAPAALGLGTDDFSWSAALALDFQLNPAAL